MEKYFNTAGPCFPQRHYMVDALKRQGKESLALIRRGQYWALHAARQSGKTTLLKALTNLLNAEGAFYAVYCTLEVTYGIAEAEKGIPSILSRFRTALQEAELLQSRDFASGADTGDFSNVLRNEIKKYCKSLDKPLVVFFDEADCLSEATLISFLRQLRDGYITQDTTPFIYSCALVGMRYIRDYKARVRSDSETLGSTSPFNVIIESMALDSFSLDDIVDLYGQHTAATGQQFAREAIDRVWEKTRRQPWLVNAIAREIVEKMLDSDYTKTVTADMVETAIQTLILRRDTHVDSLMERLKEERVRNIIQPLLLGDNNIDVMSSDFLYTRDLGLIRVTDDKAIIPANPVYAEVMVRDINVNTQNELTRNKTYQMPRYIKSGKIDIDFLLKDFQAFWRENSAMWIEHYQYKEAAPHLVLQAFLQRVINGGGDIIREMAIGAARRADICVTCQGYKYPLELKILRGQKTYREGLEQTAAYMDSLGCAEVWLIVFDRTPRKSWTKKIFMRKESFDGKKIIIVGC